MKRFAISTRDDHVLRLYYPALEVAREHCPDAKITEDNDQSRVAYIKQMLGYAEECRTVERNGSTVYILRFETSVGTCLTALFKKERGQKTGSVEKCCKIRISVF